MSDPHIVSGGRWWRGALWISAAALLLAPLVAMQFTHQISWTAFDFMVAAALLGTFCASVELAARTKSTWGTAGLAIGVGGALAILWVNLAVGIIGSEGEPLNHLFFAVLALGLLAAALARIGIITAPHALLTTAAAQVTAAAICFLLTKNTDALFAAIMAVPFLVSARLLRRENSSL